MTLTAPAIAGLFATMLLLAALPSASSLTVAARSAAHGLRHGVLVALGVITGDVALIAVVFSGLAVVARAFAGVHAALQIACGAWLVLLGVRQWRAERAQAAAAERASLAASYGAGLALTLADLKAVLFYAGLVPAFVDTARASWVDAVVLGTTAAVAIGVAKLAYARAGAATREIGASGRGVLHGIARHAPRAAAVVLVLAGGGVVATGVGALLG